MNRYGFFSSEDRQFYNSCRKSFQYQPRSASAEMELVRKMQAGDECTRLQIINNLQLYILKIAVNYLQAPGHSCRLSLQELVQEGNIGLLKALEKFDPAKNCRVITFAAWHIKDKIAKAAKKSASSASVNIKSLDAMAEQLDGGADKSSALPYCQETAVTDAAISETAGRLRAVAQKLPPEWREIVCALYGLNDENQVYSYNQIADCMNTTIKRAKNIRKLALNKMRTLLSEEGFSIENL